MTDWTAIRKEFPALEKFTYLNTATFGQVPKRSVDAAMHHFQRRNETACADFLHWFDDMDSVRAAVGELIGCKGEDLAFVSNASTGFATIVSPEDVVLTLDDEFPNNLYVATRHCTWEQFYESVTADVTLVALSTVNYNTGFVPPLLEISKFLRERRVKLFVDATQSLGALRFDVSRIEPDFVAVDPYKWLLTPNGAGFLYVSPKQRERLAPKVVGWRSHNTWRAVDNLHHGSPVLSETAEKYEGGMLPFAVLYALEASVRMFLELGPAAVEERVLSLAGRVREILQAHGAKVADYPSPIVTGRFANADHSALSRALRERQILTAARKGRLRVSPHFYNNEADLDRFEAELGACLMAAQV